MEINITLIIQMLVFGAFVWFTMKFVWPPLVKAMEERQEKIAAGLSAAERGQRELLLAQQQINDERTQFKAEANRIIENAHRLANQLIEQAKQDAKLEISRQNKMAQEQLLQETNQARTQLRGEIAELVAISVEKIINSKMTEELNHSLINKFIEEI